MDEIENKNCLFVYGNSNLHADNELVSLES